MSADWLELARQYGPQEAEYVEEAKRRAVRLPTVMPCEHHCGALISIPPGIDLREIEAVCPECYRLQKGVAA